MSSPSTPQFGVAEYKNSGPEACVGCNKPLSGGYYRVNGKLACDACVQQVKMRSPQDSHAAFVRAILFGIGGAILGLIIYSAFAILTGIMIGYVALAVGWLGASLRRNFRPDSSFELSSEAPELKSKVERKL